MTVTAYRSAIFHCLNEPQNNQLDNNTQYFPDGILLVDNGVVQRIGPADELLPYLSNDINITDYRGSLILPGFVDTHVHFPQVEMVASYGEQLLSWLDKYVFPVEAKYANQAYAETMASLFIDELLSQGTTTAMVFPSVHKSSVDALFNAALAKQMRVISGKVLMDRNAPQSVLDTAASGYDDTVSLIQAWHGKERLHYAITPRFAITSSDEQLSYVAKLREEYPDVYLQTHLAENKKEIDTVTELFPWAEDYLAVYDRYQCLGERSVFAHAIYLSDDNWQKLASTQSAVSHCPCSNLFLGSGLFDIKSCLEHGVKLSIGTDIGGGNSLSVIQNLNEAYKVAQLQGYSLSPLKAFYFATLGGAKALSLEDKVGNLQTGKEADFVVMDLAATPLVKHRMENADSITDQLFTLMMLRDASHLKATHVMGKRIL